MRKERIFDKGICNYKVENFLLNVLNTRNFEDMLNKTAEEGWKLKHIFTTAGLKLIIIWEK